jgi:ApbE superfamily uncharacterized protein (UPF0280 family)
MKTAKFQKRFYRDWIKAQDLSAQHIVVKETDVQLLTDTPQDSFFLKALVTRYRGDIEGYISKDNRFLTSLIPIAVELKAPVIVRKMCRAAALADVGPMAAVAGAIAQSLGEALLRRGLEEVIIENGGDIFLKTRKERKVGIYAGKSRLWEGLSLVIEPGDTPMGICASSGTIGHSLSFGRAESAVILAGNAFLADAVATATCNRVKSKADLNKALDFARSVKGVSGAVIIFRNSLAIWGAVELTR